MQPRRAALQLLKVLSGGQTGVDRAALDMAMAAGLAVGGCCPRGRLAEDGPIPDRYPLEETPSADSRIWTERSVQDWVGTLIRSTWGPLTGGGRSRPRSSLTQDWRRLPMLFRDLDARQESRPVLDWAASISF